MLVLVNFTHIMDFVIMAPLSPAMREALHISTNQFSWLLGSYTMSACLAGLLGSWWVDRFDRRTAMMFLFTGFTLSNLVCALSSEYLVLMLGRMLAGGFGGVLGSLLFSVIGDVIPVERRGKATGMVMSAFAGASVMGIPLGLWLAEKFFWQAPFILLAVLSALVWLLLFLRFPSLALHMEAQSQSTPAARLRSIFTDTNLQRSMVFIVVLMIAGLTVVPFLSDYLVNNAGVQQSDLKFIYIFGGIASVAVGPVAGMLSDRFGKPNVYMITAAVSIVPLWIMTHMDERPLYQLLMMSTTFFIVFGGRFVPAMALVTSSVDAARRGSFMSVNSSVQQLGSSLAVGISGIILENAASGRILNFDRVGWVAIVATIISIPLAARIKQVS